MPSILPLSRTLTLVFKDLELYIYIYTCTIYVYIYTCMYINGASFIAQSVKILSAMQETWVRFLGGEDPLEQEMATHSSILAWRIPGTEEPGGLQSTGSQSRTLLK